MNKKTHSLLSVYILEGFKSDEHKIMLSENVFIEKLSLEKRLELIEIPENDNSMFSTFILTNNEFFLYYYCEDDCDLYDPFNKTFYFADHFLEFLRSFNQGLVNIKSYRRYLKKGDEYIPIGVVGIPNRSYEYISFEYYIKSDEINIFQKFFQHFERSKLLKKEMIIAFRRLSSSYTKKDWEDKILDLLICFEALFLKVDEREELASKLASRVSSFYSKNSLLEDTYRFMKKTYNLRSKIVHGTYLNKTEFEINGVIYKANDVVIILRDVLLKSLRKILFDYPNISIDKMIDEINTKTIDPIS